jgi:hypothetical protein
MDLDFMLSKYLQTISLIRFYNKMFTSVTLYNRVSLLGQIIESLTHHNPLTIYAPRLSSFTFTVGLRILLPFVPIVGFGFLMQVIPSFLSVLIPSIFHYQHLKSSHTSSNHLSLGFPNGHFHIGFLSNILFACP